MLSLSHWIQFISPPRNYDLNQIYDDSHLSSYEDHWIESQFMVIDSIFITT